ncbi:photosynthesis regulation sensor histidine kinase CikB [Synechococcus elongatus]|uniref:Circadian input-output histidine kinase CikA n=1 Tax=Synechococcus elongatus PCC 11802 TaxID=2283154 RepID=A0AAT9JZH5_SYNEL|nr:ATPase [Synechococcus elongatus PCC 11802]
MTASRSRSTAANPLELAWITPSAAQLASTADLYFVQDLLGRYLSFAWRSGQRLGLNSDQVVGSYLSEQFTPVDLNLYLARMRRAMHRGRAEQFRTGFRFQGQVYVFDLTLSPILQPQQASSLLLVIGRQQEPLPEVLPEPPIAIAPPHHAKLFAQIAWDIRRTLDPETIWQHTVQGLGQALGLQRCLLCPYELGSTAIAIVAEYRQANLPVVLGEQLAIAANPALADALLSLRPTQAVVDFERSPAEPIWIVPTGYQEHPNGVLLLRSVEELSAGDRDLVWELADQVGTALAHARLYAQSQALALELQRANQTLLEQQQALIEAHRQSEALSQLKTDFLANTSHELRTPLTGMIGYLQLLQDDLADTPEERQEFVEGAYHSALHLLGIINDILDIARIEAGRLQLQSETVSLRSLLAEVETCLRSQAQAKGLVYRCQIAAGTELVDLWGDRQRLLQVLFNLVGNAIKFTLNGYVEVRAMAVWQPLCANGFDLPGYLKLEIEDSGIGVAPERQDSLFQPFSQADSSLTRQFGGSGLGLVICRRLLESMGGIVELFSPGEGLGTTVTCLIPLAPTATVA